MVINIDKVTKVVEIEKERITDEIDGFGFEVFRKDGERILIMLSGKVGGDGE